MKTLLALIFIPSLALADFPANFCDEDVAPLCSKYKLCATNLEISQGEFGSCLAESTLCEVKLAAKNVKYKKLRKKAKQLKSICGSDCDGISLVGF